MLLGICHLGSHRKILRILNKLYTDANESRNLLLITNTRQRECFTIYTKKKKTKLKAFAMVFQLPGMVILFFTCLQTITSPLSGIVSVGILWSFSLLEVIL